MINELMQNTSNLSEKDPSAPKKPNPKFIFPIQHSPPKKSKPKPKRISTNKDISKQRHVLTIEEKPVYKRKFTKSIVLNFTFKDSNIKNNIISLNILNVMWKELKNINNFELFIKNIKGFCSIINKKHYDPLYIICSNNNDLNKTTVYYKNEKPEDVFMVLCPTTSIQQFNDVHKISFKRKNFGEFIHTQIKKTPDDIKSSIKLLSTQKKEDLNVTNYGKWLDQLKKSLQEISFGYTNYQENFKQLRLLLNIEIYNKKKRKLDKDKVVDEKNINVIIQEYKKDFISYNDHFLNFELKLSSKNRSPVSPHQQSCVTVKFDFVFNY